MFIIVCYKYEQHFFGESVLSLFTLVDGKTLSYCYSNRETHYLVRDFQILFRTKIISYIENHDDASKNFIDLCINHVQDILNENFDFVQQSEYKTMNHML